jgi:hypothetical protein
MLPTAVSVSPPSHAPLTTVQLVEESLAHWVALYRCYECGQLWRIDVVAAQDRTSPVAIKLSMRDDWATVDDTEARHALLIREHGGLSDEICNWADCREHALLGLKICATHAHRR